MGQRQPAELDPARPGPDDAGGQHPARGRGAGPAPLRPGLPGAARGLRLELTGEPGPGSDASEPGPGNAGQAAAGTSTGESSGTGTAPSGRRSLRINVKIASAAAASSTALT